MINKMLYSIIALVLTAAIFVSAIKIADISGVYVQEAETREKTEQYRPAGEAAEVVNQNILDMQHEINEDIMGWLIVDGTPIDYPFALTSDNSYYLNHDIYKEDSATGAIFADYRNAKDMSDFNTIIYGHQVENNSMFGDLRSFRDRGYFDSHKTGTVYLAGATYSLRIFACVITKNNNPVIYQPNPGAGEGIESYLKYVSDNALYIDEEFAGAGEIDKILTLSSCTYEFKDARIVLLAKLARLQ